MLASLAFVIFAGFFAVNSAFAQERIPRETPEMEEQRERMPYTEYNNDVRTRYQQILDQVDRIQKQMVERKIEDPNFRKALRNFEVRAQALDERMKNASAVPAEGQERYRKELRADIKKLHKEYDRLLNRWEKIKN